VFDGKVLTITVFKSLPPPPVLKYHTNTVSFTSFLRNIFKAPEEESKENKLSVTLQKYCPNTDRNLR
jgi:hypothetical protein